MCGVEGGAGARLGWTQGLRQSLCGHRGRFGGAEASWVRDGDGHEGEGRWEWPALPRALGVMLCRLRCCAGCDAPASFPTRSVSPPHGHGGPSGAQWSSEQVPPTSPGGGAARQPCLRQRQLPAKALFVDRAKFAISWFGYNEFSL